MTSKLLLAIITAPFRLFITIKNRLIGLFKSLHMSIRRKIAFDYLIIYFLVGVLTVFSMPFFFSLYELSLDAQDMGQLLNQVYIAYDRQLYSDEDLQVKINQLAVSNGVSIHANATETQTDERLFEIHSDNYSGITVPDNILGSFRLLVGKGLLTKRLDNQVFTHNDSSYTVFKTVVMYPIALYREQMLVLGLMYMVFFIIGFIFISMIGGARLKKVLTPIYHMTKTAEAISLSSMDVRLDVEATKYELKDLAGTLNEMLDRLDEDYSKQKRFVSDVSHELRTPISIINGYASMLERWGKHDEQILDESIDAIRSEVGSMQQLVENLLTLVRSDNQTLKYEMESFDIVELTCDIVKEFNMVNHRNQSIECEGEMPLDVYLDRGMIKQVIRIFIDNAIKYTPDDGRITVKIRRVDQEVHVHIRDTGIGISKDDLTHLFERFYRSDESRTRETGGHGLGLSIAKVIIIGHNGRIHVKSKVGKGSEFIIILPLTKTMEG